MFYVILWLRWTIIKWLETSSFCPMHSFILHFKYKYCFSLNFIVLAYQAMKCFKFSHTLTTISFSFPDWLVLFCHKFAEQEDDVTQALVKWNLLKCFFMLLLQLWTVLMNIFLHQMSSYVLKIDHSFALVRFLDGNCHQVIWWYSTTTKSEDFFPLS